MSFQLFSLLKSEVRRNPPALCSMAAALVNTHWIWTFGLMLHCFLLLLEFFYNTTFEVNFEGENLQLQNFLG